VGIQEVQLMAADKHTRRGAQQRHRMTAHSTLYAIEAAQPAQDERLMLAVQAGDMAAFEALYKLFYPRLSRFLRRVTQQPALVEEIINETMLVVWEKPGSFDFSSKASTWIFGIAYRKALKARAKWMMTAGHVCIDDVAEVLPDRRPSTLDRLALEDALEQALAALSPEQRAVVELTSAQGLPYQEIAEILGCPENTVKTRMFHARKKLRPLLHALAPDPDHFYYEESHHDP
jgi:RNA polymerase sigma-70 factor (ECF subfamily)